MRYRIRTYDHDIRFIHLVNQSNKQGQSNQLKTQDKPIQMNLINKQRLRIDQRITIQLCGNFVSNSIPGGCRFCEILHQIQNISICLFVLLYFCLFVFLSFCAFVLLSFCLFVFLFFCFFAFMSFCLFVFLSDELYHD